MERRTEGRTEGKNDHGRRKEGRTEGMAMNEEEGRKNKEIRERTKGRKDGRKE